MIKLKKKFQLKKKSTKKIQLLKLKIYLKSFFCNYINYVTKKFKLTTLIETYDI